MVILQLRLAFPEGAGGFNPLKEPESPSALRPGHLPLHPFQKLIDIRAVQDWEQGRRIPDRAYLTVISIRPQAVLEALAG